MSHVGSMHAAGATASLSVRVSLLAAHMPGTADVLACERSGPSCIMWAQDADRGGSAIKGGVLNAESSAGLPCNTANSQVWILITNWLGDYLKSVEIHTRVHMLQYE